MMTEHEANGVAVEEVQSQETAPVEEHDLAQETIDKLMVEAQRVRRLRQDWEHLEIDAKEASKRAKEAKTVWEGASIGLERMVLGENEVFPLFDGNKPEINEVNPTDESWREVPLENLDMPERVRKALGEGGIHTMGDLADKTAEGGYEALKFGIEGIGPKAIEQIEEATTAFWASWQSNAPEAASDELTLTISSGNQSVETTPEKIKEFAEALA